MSLAVLTGCGASSSQTPAATPTTATPTAGTPTPGGGPSGSPNPATGPLAIAYVADNGNAITGLSISSSGTVSSVAGSPFPIAATLIAQAGPHTLVAASGTSLTSVQFDSSTGALTRTGSTAVATMVHSLAGDPDRGVVYAGTDSGLYGFRVNGGSFQQIAGTPILTPSSTNETGAVEVHALNIAPGGTTLVAGTSGFHASGAVVAIKVAADGSLAGTAAMGGWSGMRVAADPAAPFVFYSDVTLVAIGMLHAEGDKLTGPPPAFVNGANDLAVSPDGRYLLATDNVGGNLVHVFRVDTSAGNFTEVAGSPFAIGGNGAGRVKFDPTGAFVVAVNNVGFSSSSENVAVAKFDSASGTLTPVSGSPFAAGSQPTDVVVVRP